MARKPPPPRGPQLELAGALCVAFVNTAGAGPKNRQQGVAGYDELVSWGQQAGVLSTLEAERLRRVAGDRPGEAEAAFARAARLRFDLARIFLATAKEESPPRDALDALNAALAEALTGLRLVPGEQGLTWGWGGDENALDRVLWPVLHSAGETLVAAAGRPQVRQCAAKGCALYFVDRSASRQQRWCDMKTCGSRAKALRYYYRTGQSDRDEKKRNLGVWRKRRPRKA